MNWLDWLWRALVIAAIGGVIANALVMRSDRATAKAAAPAPPQQIEVERRITFTIVQSFRREWDDLAREVAQRAGTCGPRLITITQSESHGGNGVFIIWCDAP